VEASGLVKNYEKVEAVRGIDLTVRAGELFGFLGPNGAGKSTTIKILCTLLRPTAGSARVAGFDVVRDRDEVRRHIGLVFQETTLDDYLTAEQNLRFHAEIYGMPKASVGPRIDSVLEMVGLAERRTWSRSAATSKPATRAVPSVASARVQRILMVVDFPAPLGPRKPKVSPGRTSRSMPATASTCLKRLTSPRMEMAAAASSMDTSLSLTVFGMPL